MRNGFSGSQIEGRWEPEKEEEEEGREAKQKGKCFNLFFWRKMSFVLPEKWRHAMNNDATPLLELLKSSKVFLFIVRALKLSLSISLHFFLSLPVDVCFAGNCKMVLKNNDPVFFLPTIIKTIQS